MAKRALYCMNTPKAVRLHRRLVFTQMLMGLDQANRYRASRRQRRPSKAKRIIKELRMLMSAVAGPQGTVAQGKAQLVGDTIPNSSIRTAS